MNRNIFCTTFMESSLGICIKNVKDVCTLGHRVPLLEIYPEETIWNVSKDVYNMQCYYLNKALEKLKNSIAREN